MKPATTHIADRKYMDMLFPYAYNILGSVEDARDAVQDVVLKHLSGASDHITDEKNYLIKSVVNRAINMKGRKKPMLRAGELWLPEPVATGDAADRNLHLNEVLSFSLLVLMERLNARERAVFILKESLDYSHAEIAATLSITEEHSRKLLSRAKATLFKPAPGRTKLHDDHDRSVMERFMSAIRQRDMQQLETLLTADIMFHADGGGKVPLLATTRTGFSDVAALEILVYHKFMIYGRTLYAVINHQPALLSYLNDRLVACQVFDLHPENGKVLQINAVLDPDKLKTLAKHFQIKH